jgi:hypothetical protein
VRVMLDDDGGGGGMEAGKDVRVDKSLLGSRRLLAPVCMGLPFWIKMKDERVVCYRERW